MQRKIIVTDIEQDGAWKNGVFNFNEKDLPGALNQLSRWYDIEIHYEGKIPGKKNTRGNGA